MNKVIDPLAPTRVNLERKQYQAAAKKCVEFLQKERTSVEGWRLLGESYVGQSWGQAARLAYTRAWLLDPEANWVANVFAIIDTLPEAKVPKTLTVLLEVPEATVAAAILVKNEERAITRCLQSVAGAVDEIVVIDTGSTDGTLELVAQFSHPHLKIVHHEWDDDFAAARNAGLAVVESDWVLWIDADEYLHEEDAAAVKEVAGLFADWDKPPILRTVIMNLLPSRQIFTSFDTSRMFPSRAGLRFWGRIHEQIGNTKDDGERFLRPAVRVRLYHDGYLPEVVAQKEKQARNLRLLEKMVQEDPGNAATWLFYGRETLLAGDVAVGITRLEKAHEAAKADPEFARVPEILTWLIQAHLNLQQRSQAETLCQELLANYPEFPDGWYYSAYLRALRIQDEIMAMDRDLKEWEAAMANYRGIVSPDGLIRDWKAPLLKADLARFAGDLAQAQALYLDVYQRHPDFVGVRQQLELIETQRQRLLQVRRSNAPTQR